VAAPTLLSLPARDLGLADTAAPLPLDELVPPPVPDAQWEVEIGFGKGRYLLRRSQESPERRFLGIEIAGEYQRLWSDRARRRRLTNWLSLRGDAAYLLSAVLPAGFAAAVHVYFPDPWPKSRHQKRRLFDPESVDLVLGLLRDGGSFSFATDFLEYGELVAGLLAGYPGLEIERLPGPWPEGPRTNYEAKYEEEGRPILRLAGIFHRPPDGAPLHPQGVRGVVAAVGEPAAPLKSAEEPAR
jgi:tRNA (guanine-N7-)-methyltransferase